MKWITAEGKRIEISKMTNSHLLNALRYCQRKMVEYEDMRKAIYHPVFAPRGEYAQIAFEEEMDIAFEQAMFSNSFVTELEYEVAKRGLKPLPKPEPIDLPEYKVVAEVAGGTIYKLKEVKKKKKKRKGEKAMKDNYEFYVAGVKFHQWRDCIHLIQPGEALILEPEPDNKYDPCAIKILFENDDTKEKFMLGYVPANHSPQVAALVATAVAPVCEVRKVSPDAKPWQCLFVEIYDLGKDDIQDA